MYFELKQSILVYPVIIMNHEKNTADWMIKWKEIFDEAPGTSLKNISKN